MKAIRDRHNNWTKIAIDKFPVATKVDRVTWKSSHKSIETLGVEKIKQWIETRELFMNLLFIIIVSCFRWSGTRVDRQALGRQQEEMFSIFIENKI